MLAKAIRNIINTSNVPKKGDSDHFDLLTFLVLTDIRNPVNIQNTKDMFDSIRNSILELDSNADVDNIFPRLTHDSHIKLALSKLMDSVLLLADLDYKLLINVTDKPFICSDFPVVKYNQFLELKKWQYSKTGFGLVGLQIFIPLNSEIMLLFFDSAIYKVGFKKQKIYRIIKQQDIDSINILQFVNCFDTVYFNDKASETYIKKLHDSSKKYKRANVSRSELNYLIENEKDRQEYLKSGKKNFLIVGNSDCETQLNIDGLKIHSKGKVHQLNPTLSQLRPHAEKMKNNL